MLNHGYLAQRLRRPLPTKDGGTLHTVADAANYIVALRKIGVGPIGTALLNSSWIWRTHPRSAASSNSPCFMIGSSISKCRHAETSTYVRGSSRGDCQSLIPPTRRSNAALFMLLTWRSDLLGGSDVLVGELLPRAG